MADAIPAAIFIEQENRCCYVNRAAQNITGYNQEELLGMNFSQLIHTDSRDALEEHRIKQQGGDLSISRYEIKLLTRQTEEVRWLDIAAGTFLLNGEFAALTTGFDVTERKRAERQTEDLRDPLTGVASRQRLVEIFDTEAIRTGRTGRQFSLLIFILNGMKRPWPVRQLVASRALCRFARTMQLHCRSLDMLARVGTDRFAFVLPETAPDGALILGRRIATRLANDGEEPILSCVYGTAALPQDGKTFDELFELADRQAMAHNLSDEAKLPAPTGFNS